MSIIVLLGCCSNADCSTILKSFQEINMFTKNNRSIKRKIKETKELLKIYTALLILFNLSFGQITSTFEPVIRDGRWNTASKYYQSSPSRRNQFFCKFFIIFGVRLGKPLNKQTPFKN